MLPNAPELIIVPQPLVVPEAPEAPEAPPVPPVNPLPVVEYAQDPYPVLPASEEADSTEDALPEEEAAAAVQAAVQAARQAADETALRVANEAAAAIVEARQLEFNVIMERATLVADVVVLGMALCYFISLFHK
jgi:hypothetical protein